MTKFIEQRVDELENQVAKLELIIHELRGKKSIEPSTTNTVEDIIEFEGKLYRKVDREAREGDYVSVSFENGKCFKPNKLYGPAFFEDKRLRVKADPSSGGEYEITQVYHDLYGRTPETVDVYELMKEGLNPQIPIVDETIEPLTPNQQRAAIIEKAKKFVDDLKDKEGKYSKPATFGDRKLRFEFVVNPEKRTVVALGRLFYYPSIHTIYAKGIAKCNPSDVFNEHIGKAIALGRALGLDVSEFEQAVQPNDFVSGQIIKADHLEHLGEHQLTKVENHRAYFDHNGEKEFHWADRIKEGDFHIINDTNAKYEVES